jgi:thioredoxin-like negative regulator of GroEL
MPRGRRLRTGWPAGGAMAVALLASLSAAALADTPAASEQPFADTPDAREADALFQQLLKDPKNVDLTFRYAQAAIKSGNIEGGISSLERLLLLDRNFPGVKIQLAELYARIHSYDVAKAYLAQARDEPGVNQATLDRIQAVQVQIDRAASPANFSANLLVGLRYQSNASAEPAGSDIIAGGVPQTLSTIYLFKPAWDSFATGNMQYTIDLGGVPVESNAIAYYSKSLGHSVLDLGAIEVNSGPRFDVDAGGFHFFSARPYALANEVTLGESQFLHGVGAGLGIDRQITDQLSGGAFYEFRRDWFSNVALAQDAIAMNANLQSFGTSLSYRVIENGDLNLQVSYAITDETGPDSNKGLVLHPSYSQLINLPPDWGVGPLNVSPFLYWIYSHENSPDAMVSTTSTEWTSEWRYGITLKLGLTDNLAANFHLLHQVSVSNIAADNIRDTQVILGVVFSY